MGYKQVQPLRFMGSIPYNSEFFFNPWRLLWNDMRSQTDALEQKFADKKGLPCRQLQSDIASLAAWMHKKKAKDKVAKANMQWLGMVLNGGAAAAAAGKLLSYYRDLWSLVRCGGDSVDAAYRCIDFVREFPQRISWDMEEAQKRCGLAVRKGSGRFSDMVFYSAQPHLFEESVYDNMHSFYSASLDDESRLVVA